MKRWFGSAMLLVSLTLSGCGTDPREGHISTIIQNLNDAATRIGSIRESVASAVKKAENNTLKKEDLNSALESIKSLSDTGKKFQELKNQTDSLAASTSEEDRKAFREKFQNQLSSALTRAEEERRGLEVAVKEAEAVNAEQMKDLRQKLTEADGVFFGVARQR